MESNLRHDQRIVKLDSLDEKNLLTRRNREHVLDSEFEIPHCVQRGGPNRKDVSIEEFYVEQDGVRTI